MANRSVKRLKIKRVLTVFKTVEKGPFYFS